MKLQWTLIILLLCNGTLQGQRKIKVNGGFSLGGELYSVTGIADRRSPYSYYINGRVVFSYGDFSIPLTASYRDAQFSFDYNMNRLGIAPSYKWIKLYIGWNNIHYSRYTMSGRAFRGIGLELTPGIFYFNVMAGKIQNSLAVQDTQVYGADLIPTFERNVKGVKIGIRKKRNKLEIMAVHIADDAEQQDYVEEYNTLYGYQVLTPKENLSFGLNGSLTLFKIVDVFFNTGASALTADSRDTLFLEEGNEIPDFISDNFRINGSTRLSLAGDGGINIRIKGYKVGFKYRRVDPFYSTLATNYFNNDLEQYTFTAAGRFFKHKIHVNAQVGLEENNLTGMRAQTTNRFIGNVNASIQLTDMNLITLQYSNFQTESQNTVIAINDTFRYVSISQFIGGQWNYRFREKPNKQRIALQVFYNKVRDLSESNSLGNLGIFTSQVSYSFTSRANNLTVTPSLNYNNYQYPSSDQTRYGVALRVSKHFFDKKLSVSLGSNFYKNFKAGQDDGFVSNSSLRASYRVSKNSMLSLSSYFIVQQSTQRPSFREIRSMIRYSHNF